MLKKVGTCIYAHKSNLDELKEYIGDVVFNKIKDISMCLPSNFKFDIVKFDKKSSKVSFISSPDWDISREPLVGVSYCTELEDENRIFKIIKSKGQIYHHKWMFVSNEYDGFDVEESKKWSDKWTKIFPKDKTIKSRIGYKKYWDEYLKLFDLEIDS